MSDSRKGPARRSGQRSFTTKSGKTLKLNRNFGDRLKATRNQRATQKALFLSTLPKNKWKRLAYRLHPKRLAAYWFSREGAIMALKVTGIGIVVCFFLTIGVFAYFRKDLPKIKGIAGDKLGGSITYYDNTGKTVLWQDYDAVKRIPVESDQISPYMKNATIAIEDKDFYKHGAFDVRGILRASVNDVTGGGPIQGGSTITQQLVKLNEQWTDNRTITRKIKELILAVELEREYSKNDILTGYLNAAPYGGIENGVEVAARDYFNTNAKDLTLAQASMLAAIPRAPSYYSPYSSSQWNSAVTGTEGFGQDALISRQHYILDQMVKQGMVTEQQANEAKAVDVLAQVQPLKSKYNGIRAPYFVLAAKRELEKRYTSQTVQRGGWKVTTTLNLDLQNLAEKEVAAGLHTVKSFHGDNIAFVAEDVPTGQMVALVGGVDFNNNDFGKINYAQTPLPPGSSFKPYDYATFINNNPAGAGSVLYDTQGPLPGYPCTNKATPKEDPKNHNCEWDYDLKYPGPLTLRYALAGSRNVPAIKAMLSAVPNDKSNGRLDSVNKVISTAEQMQSGGKGFGYNCYLDANYTRKGQCYGASAIGDGAFLHLDEHANGLATLSRLGNYIPQTYILKIEDAAGKTLLQWKQPKAKQVLKPDAAYIVDSILSDPNASYLRAGKKFQHQGNGWNFAVKTGTTNDNYDGLMTSWSTKYAAVTWVGYHTRQVAMTAGHMEDMTEPIMRGWMESAHKNLPPQNWTAPSGVKTLPAFVVTTSFGTGAVLPSPRTDVFPSWYNPKSGTTSSATIDKVSGLLATSCTPAAAKVTTSNSNSGGFSVDVFVNGSLKNTSSAPTASDNVHSCGDTHPSVTITPPASACGPSACQFSVTPFQGTHPLSGGSFGGTVTVSINGSQVGSYSAVDSQPIIVQYTPTSTGTVTITATVTDSVLYSDSSSQSMTTVAAGGQ